jgi:hypothetical protein
MVDYYADSNEVEEKLTGQLETIPETILEQGMLEADRTINFKVKNMPVTVPDEIVGIATLLASAYILDQLHPTAKDRDIAATQWEKRALSELDSYLENNPNEDNEDNDFVATATCIYNS